MKNKKLLGNGLLLLTAFIWGTAFVAQRIGMDSIEPITFNAARMVLAAIVVGLLSYILWLKEKNTAGKSADEIATKSADEVKEYNKNTIKGGILCGLFLSIASISQQMGLVYTTAGKAGFITAMYMLLVPIAGTIIFKKKNPLIVWLAVLLGIVGMYFLCITEEFRLSKGDALVLVCAFFFCGHILCIDHFVEKANPIRMAAIQFATAAVVSGIVAAFVENPSIDALKAAAIPIVYCGLMSGGIGYTLQIVGQKYTEPAIASLLMSMESVFAVVTGVILLHEAISFRETAGCVIMFAAIILVQIPLLKSSKVLSEGNGENHEGKKDSEE